MPTDLIQRLAVTRALAARAVRENPSDVRALFGAGVAYRLSGDYPSALAHFQRACALQPRNQFFLFELGNVHEYLGQPAEAADAYRRSIKSDPNYFKSRHALVQIEKQTEKHNCIPELKALFNGHDADGWRTLHAGHALAKSYEDLGDITKSFEWLTRGKVRRRQQCPYSSADREQLLSAAKNSLANLPAATVGYPSNEPIFVVGMPRTGTTLVDRILSSHAQVTSAGEIGNFAYLFKRMSATTTKSTLDVETLSSGAKIDFAKLGQYYIDSTRPLTGAAPRFIDKAPSNYLLAGLILKALPRAKIICLQRNALDTCLSNYKQIFPIDDRYYDYVYDLPATAHQYIHFKTVTEHWKSTLPKDRFLQVNYEDLVANQEPQTRLLLEFCELPWDANCLEFHRNAAGVATPSAAQVRQEMYTTSSGRWLKYGGLLDPAKEVLEKAGF